MKKTAIMLLAGFFALDVAFGGGGGCNKENTGTVSGAVTFHGINCQPGQPDFNVPPCTGPYPNYKIEVYLADGSTLALTAMTDPKGHYSVNLPDGKYVIYTQNGPMEANREKHEISVAKGKTQELNLDVKTGIQ